MLGLTSDLMRLNCLQDLNTEPADRMILIMRSRKLLKAASYSDGHHHHHHHHYGDNAAVREKQFTIESSNFNGINEQKQPFNSTQNPSTPIDDDQNYASSFHVDYNEPKTHPPKNN